MGKKIPRSLLIIGGIALVAIIYFVFNPEREGFFPPCPFHYLTGFECPGCGSQRAIHYLLHFEIGEAFMRNPLLVLSIPYLTVGFYFEYFGGRLKYPRTRKILFGQRAIFIILSIIILYWIGRNLPLF